MDLYSLPWYRLKYDAPARPEAMQRMGPLRPLFSSAKRAGEVVLKSMIGLIAGVVITDIPVPFVHPGNSYGVPSIATTT